MEQSTSTEGNVCLNCGTFAPERFCPYCGQSTRVKIPTLYELVHDTLGAIFSYDSKLWQTVGTLVTKPGQLTLDYFEGKRARYLNPFQVFFWLQAVAFLAHRTFYSTNAADGESKSRLLLLVGICIAAALSLIYYKRKQKFVFHLVAAVHIWAFLMLWLLGEYVAVPFTINLLVKLGALNGTIEEGQFVTWSSIAALAVYVVLSLRKVYGISWRLAILQMSGIFVAVISLLMLFHK